MSFSSITPKAELLNIKSELLTKYQDFKDSNLCLDMSRGKPSKEQLDLSNSILTSPLDTYISSVGDDIRNYGVVYGIKETRELFANLLDLNPDDIIIGGNSTLKLIYDSISNNFIFGKLGSTPWSKLDKVKFICPVPGYDRHFSICEEFGIEMINVPLYSNGPDMDIVEELVNNDDSIKGMFCVPLYSNPSGACYSDEVVDRLAKMSTAANDFTIYWDNAYGIHHIYDEVKLYNIFDACKKYSTEDRVYYYFSTSKVTFPGSGIAIITSGKNAINEFKKRFSTQTIGYNKINQLRTLNFLKDVNTVKLHMNNHAKLLKERFDIVLDKLKKDFSANDLLKWETPNGGYFISVETLDGCAKETVRLAKECGLILTDAGASYPYHNDPNNSNIRLAPSYPNANDLAKAMDVFCVCVKLAAVNKLLK